MPRVDASRTRILSACSILLTDTGPSTDRRIGCLGRNSGSGRCPAQNARRANGLAPTFGITPAELRAMQTATPTTPIVAREGRSANVGSLLFGRRTGITHGYAMAHDQTNLGTLMALGYPHGYRRDIGGCRRAARWPLDYHG